MELTGGINVDQALNAVKEKYKGELINTQDGVKIDFEKTKEWVHLRKSNTEPIIRIYAESADEKKAAALAERLISDIRSFM
jgi:phosphomannomutase